MAQLSPEEARGSRRLLADRLLAGLLDLLLVLAWVAVLAAVGAGLALLGVTDLTQATDPVVGNLVGFLTLVAPVTVVAAWLESHRGTPGKRARRLHVVHGDGGAPGFALALARNTLKIALPWQLGHSVVFALFGTTTGVPPAVIPLIVVTYAIPLAYFVTLVVPPRRALYDRLVGTGVERVR